MGFSVDREKPEVPAPHRTDGGKGKKSGWRARLLRMTIMFVCVIVVLVVFGPFFLNRLLRKQTSIEASAISSVRNLVSSQITYSATTGAGTYATSLGTLSTAKLIDSVLGSGTKDGYTFAVSTGTGNTTFTLTARPQTYSSTSTRSFFADETGVIRYNTADAAADSTSPALGKTR